MSHPYGSVSAPAQRCCPCETLVSVTDRAERPSGGGREAYRPAGSDAYRPAGSDAFSSVVSNSVERPDPEVRTGAAARNGAAARARAQVGTDRSSRPGAAQRDKNGIEI